uniref:FMN hydroxy acid dehydrogenase domain-containing protein n=1 Tax=Branchiostoma floridae TaxID=7739 RepID=C3Z5N1_BRAFL|eukprot:XP_002596132.1 hypothetical protein BRAFLDRAFT_66139 [Branchiostoma floridae]
MSVNALTSIADFEKSAHEKLPDFAWSYYSRTSDAGQTQDGVGFKVPRGYLMQRLSPALKSFYVPSGATAMKTGMVLSSWSNHSLEEVAEATPRGIRWFYMLFYKDRNHMKRLLGRAERAGYSAIFLTIDSPIFPFSTGRPAPGAIPVPLRFPNVFDEEPPHAIGTAEYRQCLRDAVKEPATWEDVEWVRENTRLPVVLKGILSDVLPDIVRAVDGKAEVYLDGGVRTGTDVLKALALGARCVFIGRPALWGLAHNYSSKVALAVSGRAQVRLLGFGVLCSSYIKESVHLQTLQTISLGLPGVIELDDISGKETC